MNNRRRLKWRARKLEYNAQHTRALGEGQLFYEGKPIGNMRNTQVLFTEGTFDTCAVRGIIPEGQRMARINRSIYATCTVKIDPVQFNEMVAALRAAVGEDLPELPLEVCCETCKYTTDGMPGKSCYDLVGLCINYKKWVKRDVV